MVEVFAEYLVYGMERKISRIMNRVLKAQGCEYDAKTYCIWPKD